MKIVKVHFEYFNFVKGIMMEILLPKPCLGEHILSVFAQAATYEVHMEKRWDAVETIESNGVVIEPLFVLKNSVFNEKGVDIILSTKKPRWWFFGEEVWKREETPIVRLSPLDLKEVHESVEILVRHTVMGKEGVCFVQDPGDPRFAEFSPHYDATLKMFLHELANYRY